MTSRIIMKIVTPCILFGLLTSCAYGYRTMFGQNYGTVMELQNGKWVVKKPEPPKPPSAFELEVQKKLVDDVLVGHACNNKYSFEIKITGMDTRG